ncbi:MAG: Rpn family recombination-promoting nuclease/putative transposase [Lachnospiraceae bacterium]|nr:Rpn family recombination-promoting nuclease/putative transposase [Lachnospiraceae bacterium]
MKKVKEKKPFEQLTITDNYMFQAVMKDPKHVKPLLEMVLGKKVKRIEIIEPEKVVETGYDSRGIRMDVYVEDDEGTVYDVEMQASKKRHFGKRFRYYQSAIDVDVVNKGEGFGKLKKSFIIFITTYDPYGKGWYMYPFETICSWDSDIKMNDSAMRIVLNTKGTKDKEGHEVSEEIKEMLSYMNGNAPESEYSKMLDEAVKKVKHNEERRLEYMNINANSAEDKELGEYRKLVNQIRNCNYPDDLIVDILRIKGTTLVSVRNVISEHPDWDDEEVAEEVLSMED